MVLDPQRLHHYMYQVEIKTNLDGSGSATSPPLHVGIKTNLDGSGSAMSPPLHVGIKTNLDGSGSFKTSIIMTCTITASITIKSTSQPVSPIQIPNIITTTNYTMT